MPSALGRKTVLPRVNEESLCSYCIDTVSGYFGFVDCKRTKLGFSVSHKEWITTSIFTQQRCGREHVAKGFLQNTFTSFCGIVARGFL